MIKGIIFDLDGVITSTSYQHYLAWKAIAEELGVNINDKFENEVRGISRQKGLELLINKKPGLKLTAEEKEFWLTKKNDIYHQLISNLSTKDILPNVQNFIEELIAHKLKLALASISASAYDIVSKLNLAHYFDYIVSVNEIKNMKPAPDIFLAALVGLNLQNSECVVIEDAESGIQAAQAVGIKTIGINVAADIKLKNTMELNFGLIKQLQGENYEN